MQKTEVNMTPAEHAQHIANLLQQAQQECRADIGRIDDPKAQALFETAAEVMGGLLKALEHYQTGSEPAWQHSSGKYESKLKEAETITGMSVTDRSTARRAAQMLIHRGGEAVVMQAGHQGDLAVWNEGERWLPRIPVKAVLLSRDFVRLDTMTALRQG